MTSSIGDSRVYKSPIEKNSNGNMLSTYYHKTKEDAVSVSNKTAHAQSILGYVGTRKVTELTIFTLNPYAKVFVPNEEIMYDSSNPRGDFTFISPSIPSKEIPGLSEVNDSCILLNMANITLNPHTKPFVSHTHRAETFTGTMDNVSGLNSDDNLNNKESINDRLFQKEPEGDDVLSILKVMMYCLF